MPKIVWTTVYTRKHFCNKKCKSKWGESTIAQKYMFLYIFNDQERKKQLSFSKALREGVRELGVQWCEGTCTGSIRHLVRCEQISGLISHHGPPLPPSTQWFIIDETSYRWLLKTILQDKAKTQKFAAAERISQ